MMAEASFQLGFDFQMAGRQIRRIAALTCNLHVRTENHNQFSYHVSRCGAC
jgi:hypothetical protein